ncbi:MAG: SAM-dependent methyltransferase [Bacteroidia bacterium]|nr:SAM-dependent methyltransferase [Bacteroidia bacterium]MCZ2277184.1 SAM-dependent methyltransferase [Bacteroidia bacterium]
MKNGHLFLIPSLLGGTNPDILPGNTIDRIRSINFFIVENAKEARRFLKVVHPGIKLQNLNITEIDKHDRHPDWKIFLRPALEGNDLGLISDCGSPAIADPGKELISTAHRLNISVKPLTGPSSILLALMASGFNGQQFSFHGYLPYDVDKSKRLIQKLEIESQQQNRTQIFIETPYRNREILHRLITTLTRKTLVSVCCSLTCSDEWIKTQPVSEWKKISRNTDDLFQKNPCVFLFYAGD